MSGWCPLCDVALCAVMQSQLLSEARVYPSRKGCCVGSPPMQPLNCHKDTVMVSSEWACWYVYMYELKGKGAAFVWLPGSICLLRVCRIGLLALAPPAHHTRAHCSVICSRVREWHHVVFAGSSQVYLIICEISVNIESTGCATCISSQCMQKQCWAAGIRHHTIRVHVLSRWLAG